MEGYIYPVALPQVRVPELCYIYYMSLYLYKTVPVEDSSKKKKKFYKLVVRPDMMYGLGMVAWTKRQEVLRFSFGVTRIEISASGGYVCLRGFEIKLERQD